MNNKNKSFTLIELLVVIVIIGILAGVIMISTSSAIDKANIAKVKVFEESVQNNLADSMVSRWSFDTGSTISGSATNDDVKDVWGSNNGDITGHAPIILTKDKCVSGKCLQFDGSYNNYVQVSAIPSLKMGTSFVLSAWVYSEHTNTYRTIVGYNNTHRLLICSDGTMLSQQNGNFHSQTGAVPNQKWTHVVYWCNGSEERWYIDGVLSGVPRSIIDAEWDQAFKIGQYDLVNYAYKGRIDDVKVYNNAFSAQNIKKEYLLGLSSLLNNGSVSKEEYNKRLKMLAKY